MSLRALLLRPSVLASAVVHVVAVAGLAWGGGTPGSRRGAELPGIATVEATFAGAAPDPEIVVAFPDVEPDATTVTDADTPPPHEFETPEPDRPFAVEVPREDALPAPESSWAAGTIFTAPSPHVRVRPRRPKSNSSAQDSVPAPPPRPALASRGSTSPLPLDSNPPPEYPVDAVARGWQGTALVLVVVRADGTVAQASLSRSSGHPLLDDAALAAVRGWRYAPAVLDGVPVGDRVLQPVEFRLRDRP